MPRTAGAFIQYDVHKYNECACATAILEQMSLYLLWLWRLTFVWLLNYKLLYIYF